ncbi:hypothetical protein HDU76_008544 [Blyttiomyces sp. JEL0837]|nr:hypothetical protein HDU76_008544 [Blyttiomyces sp. JEL0837]
MLQSTMQKGQYHPAPTASTPFTSTRSHEVHATLTALNKDITEMKRHGSPSFAEIQAIAERTWRANLAYETQIARLDREKEMLNRLVDTTWSTFDNLIRPLWRIDDSIVPIYDALAAIRLQLEDLASRQSTAIKSLKTPEIPLEDLSLEVRDQEQELWRLQERIHEIENKHVVDGKFVPEGWDVNSIRAGGKVPGGQAVIANLLARCYRLVRKIQEAEPTVSPKLFPIELRLENVVTALRAFKMAIQAGAVVEPIELRLLQEHVDSIDSARIDGKFVDEDGNIPEGQSILHDLLNEAYDLIHDCITEIEAQQGSETDGDLSGFLATLTQKVRDVRDAVFSTASVKPRVASAASSSATAVTGGDDSNIQQFAPGTVTSTRTAQGIPTILTTPSETASTIGSLTPTVTPAPTPTLSATGSTGASAGLVQSSPALHTFAETLTDALSHLKSTVSATASATATVATMPWTMTKKQLDKVRLASALQSGFSVLARALGVVEPVDESLADVYERLVSLRGGMIRARAVRDKRKAGKLGYAGEGVAFVEGEIEGVGSGDEEISEEQKEVEREEVRKFIEELEAVDRERDDKGNFLNKEGGAAKGQAALRSLLEECYCLAYDLM